MAKCENDKPKMNGRTLSDLLSTFKECDGNVEQLKHERFEDIDLENVSLTNEQVTALMQIVVGRKHLKKLRMERCNLTNESLEIMASNLLASHLKIDKVDISRNKNVGTTGFKYLGQIVQHCEVQSLVLREMQPTGEEIQSLLQGIGEAKLQVLDVSNTRVGKIGKRLRVRSLDGSPTFPTLQLSPGLGGGLVEMMADDNERPSEPPEDVILDILPHVTKCIRMENWEIEVQGQDKLTTELNSKEILDLKIVYGEHGTCVLQSSIFAVKKKKVGIKGGCIETGNCKISFPHKAMPSEKEIKISLDYNVKEKIKDFIPVSPIINCTPSMSFGAKTLFNVKSWIALDPKSKMDVHVFWREDDQCEWKQMAIVTSKGRNVEFTSDHFSDFRLAVRKDQGTPVKLWLANLVYHDDEGNVTPLFCVDEKEMIERQTQNITDMGLARTFPFVRNFKSCLNHELCYTIAVNTTDGFSIAPSSGETFTVEEDFRSHFKSFQIENEDANTTCQLRIDYNIMEMESEGGVSWKISDSQRLKWPLQTPASRSRDQVTSNIYATGNAQVNYNQIGGAVSSSTESTNVQPGRFPGGEEEVEAWGEWIMKILRMAFR